MKASPLSLGAATLAVAALGCFEASSARAQYFNPPQGPNPYYQPNCPVRVAPDMCGGYYFYNDGYNWYGPNYYVYPPFPPFNGILPGQQAPPGFPKGPAPTPYQFYQQQSGCGPFGQGAGPGGPGGPGGNVALPINPWTRSPRDFFMWTEAQQEIITRQTRPAFVP